MSNENDRQWWPFCVEVPVDQRSPEMAVTLDFLNAANRPGVRPFLQHNELECGAVADNGRECVIVWRGKHRAEVILLKHGEAAVKLPFFAAVRCEAFRDASVVALQWIADETG